MNRERKTIANADLAAVLFRSFLIQASWSFDRLQSLGFAFAMIPALRRLYPDPEAFRARLYLHAEYFNTQPYLASFVLGATIRAEEEHSSDPGKSTDVSGLKNTLMAPLGALGDSFFWGGLKPLSALIAVSLLMAGAWWAPLLFLVFYNSWHLSVRTAVLFWGYRTSGDVVSLIARYRFTRLARLFKAVALTVLGGVVGMVTVWRPEFRMETSAPGLIVAAAGFGITVFLTMLLRKGGSPVKLMLGLAVLCIALAYAGVS